MGVMWGEILSDGSDIVKSSMERAPWGWVLMLSVILALIKVWPIISAQAIEVRAKLRGERRDDLHNCQQRLDAMDVRLTESEAKTHQFELKLVGVLTGYRILESDVELRDPTSSALAHARRAMRDAFVISEPPPPDMEAVISRIQ